MTIRFTQLRRLGLTTALAALTACAPSEFDWDLRRNPNALNTSDAALNATQARPQADARGVLSYPGYQVAVAQRGDTVASVAARVGVDAGELARFNALQPGNAVRAGEVLALPRRVAGGVPTSAGTTTGAVIGSPIQTGPIDVTTLAGGAIDRASTTTGQPGNAAASAEPARHRVTRGETAFGIARSYNVSPRALADWNGLDANMTVREGQYLLIPVTVAGQSAAPAAVTAPGSGTPTPVPPSASKPLPDQTVAPAVGATKPAGTPTSPALGESRSAASAARYAMPVDGKIIRGYAKGKNEGIDIAANAGTPVRAASDGTVAVITKDTNQVLTLVIRNSDDLLTVYAGIDGATVAKGDKIKRGQTIAKVRAADPAFLHFEVRKGMDSQDPTPFLQ